MRNIKHYYRVNWCRDCVVGAVITYILTLLTCLFRVSNHDRGRNNEVYKVSVSCKENTLSAYHHYYNNMCNYNWPVVSVAKDRQ